MVLYRSSIPAANLLAKGIELWQKSQQQVPECHEAESKEEADNEAEMEKSFFLRVFVP